MKNYLKNNYLYYFLAVFIILSLFILTKTTFAQNELEDRLSGRILLQVEDHGEAWYLNPKTLERSFLGRPDDAFRVMREEGLGISNTNLDRIPISLDHNVKKDSDGDGLSDAFENAIGTDPDTSDTDGDGYEDYTELENDYNPNGKNRLGLDKSYAQGQKGRIFLAVERNGEAWYIYPGDSKRYFLGRPDDAFQLMRSKGLGISNKSLNQIRTKAQNQNQNGQSENADDRGNGAQSQDRDQDQSNNDSQDESEENNDEVNSNSEIFKKINDSGFDMDILNCNEGKEFKYSTKQLLPFIAGYYNSENEVKILNKLEDDMCEIQIETWGSYEMPTDFNDQEIAEYITSNAFDLFETEDQLKFAITAKLSELEADERFNYLFTEDDGEAIIDKHAENYDPNQTFIDWFKIKLNSMMEDVGDTIDFDETDRFTNICSGEEENLLQYFIDQSNGNMSASCSMGSSETVCTYNDNVTCTQATQVVEN
ncbi:MAG: hypothetical protein PF488_00175 [Patescibacteria group bacterium]|jgi:hypothetical protein|nr:hypothetical protein [Patescibacteria group bacterium]